MAFAIPKSISFNLLPTKRKLAGFRSECTILWSWITCTASSICRQNMRTSSNVSLSPRCKNLARSVSPYSNKIRMRPRAGSTSASCTWMMLGLPRSCFRMLTSLTKLSKKPGLSGQTTRLRAKTVPRSSQTLYTLLLPPWPRYPRREYGRPLTHSSLRSTPATPLWSRCGIESPVCSRCGACPGAGDAGGGAGAGVSPLAGAGRESVGGAGTAGACRAAPGATWDGAASGGAVPDSAPLVPAESVAGAFTMPARADARAGAPTWGGAAVGAGLPDSTLAAAVSIGAPPAAPAMSAPFPCASVPPSCR
mmetsp:Transcript_8831/g.22254  ORF Transcript_8831/g.22254 Transcript_8831/m.22254 type:complete len:307 (+) Transcript_8831:801-1721(+)